MAKHHLAYLLALFAGASAAAVAYTATPFPYGSDSAFYLEQARSFLSRGVFEVTPWNTQESTADAMPDFLFPPGYPLVLALSHLVFRFPVEAMAPPLSLAALLLLPAAVVLTFHRVTGPWPALGIGLLTALTPAAIKYGYYAYPDALSLMLTIYVFRLVLSAGGKTMEWCWLGLLGGFSYVLRNANLGLLASIGLYLLWRLAVDPRERKHTFRHGLVWLGASAVVLIPYFVRNVRVFGKLQPYWMPPSTVSLGQNIRDYLKVQLDTLLVADGIDEALARTPWGNLLLMALAAAIARQVIVGWRRWQVIEQKAFFLSLAYAGIGAAMVIAARTKYQWGTLIVDRYALPYLCFVLVALAIVCNNFSFKFGRHVAVGLASIALAARLWALPQAYERTPLENKLLLAVEQIRSKDDVICQKPKGRLAVSNWSTLYRTLCAAPVRYVGFDPRQQSFEASLAEWAALEPNKGVLVSLFPLKDGEPYDFPLTPERIARLNSSGWQVERNNQDNLTLAREGVDAPGSMQP